MFRLALLSLLFAGAAPLCAFFGAPAGFGLTEYQPANSVSGIVWDPAIGATEFYASSNGIRRFNPTTGALAATALFAAPAAIAPATYAFFDSLAIDPTATNDIYVSYSGNFSRLYKLTRIGPDASLIVTSVDYSTVGEYIFQLLFVPDLPTVPVALRGQLLAAGAVGFSGVAKIYRVNKTTLALTELIDVGTMNGSGAITVDAAGNIYSVVPTGFGSFIGSEIKRFAAADVAAALGGTPVAATQAQSIIATSANEWNITALTARQEGGSTFLYFATQEHASMFRLCVETGEKREFMHGFGGVSDGYSHFAQGGGIAFSSALDNFHPAGGGSTVMVLPFSVFTPGFASFRFVYVIKPEPVNVAVASLAVTQQPVTVNSGTPFSVTVQALNSGGTPLLSNVGVITTASGTGTLRGFSITSKPGNALLIDGLVYSSGTLPATFTLSVQIAGAPAVTVTTASIQVVGAAAALAIVSQPASAAANGFFGATVELRDSSGIRVQSGADAAREVTVTKTSGPGNLYGDTNVTAASGQAVFAQILLDMPGTYVLRFTSPGLPAATLNLQVTAAAQGNGTASDNGGSCTTGADTTSHWVALLAIAGLLGLAFRLLRSATRVAAK